MRPTSLPVTVLIVLTLLLAACGSLSEVCGERSSRGGPPVLRTRQQELCEAVRISVLRHLQQHPGMLQDEYERLAYRSESWPGASSTADLLERVRRGGGEDLAAAIADVLRRSAERSRLPLTGEGGDDTLLARAAGHGAHLGVKQSENFVAPGMEIEAIFGGGDADGNGEK